MNRQDAKNAKITKTARSAGNQQSEIINQKSEMSAEEFRALRMRSGLGPVAFARQLGVTYKALYHWEHGERAIGGPVARLARLLVPDAEISGRRTRPRARARKG